MNHKKQKTRPGSLPRALAILDGVTGGADTLKSLTEHTGMASSTVHRILALLVDEGLLVQLGRTYRLSARLIELGEHARRNYPLKEVAAEPMRELSRATRETVHLGVLDGTDIIYLEKISGDRGLQMASYVGLRSPAQTTAMGKALIANLPEDRWPHYFQPLEPRTPNSITTLGDFLAELAAVREEGCAFDREENEVGVRCVAAAVTGSAGLPQTAVSLSGATIYIDEARQLELVPYVRACAADIATRISGSAR